MPSELGDPRTDDVALGHLIAVVHQTGRDALGRALRPLNLETRHFAVLVALDRHGPASQRRISDLLDLDKSAMVRIMDELERMGLAARARAEHDRRAYAIDLTPEGRARAAAAAEVTAEVTAGLYGRLSGAERDQLVALLARLAP
ncbi:MarR family winged helix-turn-helix transcriptional regulator [Spirillospora sp. CA-294931]|uniref:MarR family winged helix-turn-helix transcriptional regulator n=1 Tax=Spirillospora sp. CA-294931 TaxID=3240042 RepID=UPI003D93B149